MANFTGNDLPNLLIGTNESDYIQGLGGNDVLVGLGGNDNLDGGTGIDTMIGGAGNDYYYVDDVRDTISELGNDPGDFVVSTISFNMNVYPGIPTGAPNIENLFLSGGASIFGFGNSLNNRMTGNAGNNELYGGEGNDTLDGRGGVDYLLGELGDDTYIVNDAFDTVSEATNEGNDTVNASISYTLTANVESLTLTNTGNINGTGNDLDNLIVGNDGNNFLSGLGGNDTIEGGIGDDTLEGGIGTDSLVGGLGNDTYVLDVAGDTIAENAGEGVDTVQVSSSYTLGANQENLILTGNGNVSATGNELNNILTGNAGNNILDSKAGIDTLIGGLGKDTYVVDTVTDRTTENMNEGVDTVQSSVSYILGDNLESLTLTGTGNINGTGNDLDNLLIGNAGVNTLSGGKGNDTLIGGAARDFLEGGEGADRFVFGSPTDRVDRVMDFSRREKDKLVFVSNGLDSFDGLQVGRVKKDQFVVGKRAADKNDRFIYNEKKGVLFYDEDGKGGVGQVRIATFADQPTLGAKDLLVVASPF